MSEYKRMMLAVLVASLFIYLWTSLVVKPGRRATRPGPNAPDSSVVQPQQHPPEQPVQQRPGADVAALAFQAPAPVAGPARLQVVTSLCEGELVALGGGLGAWRLKPFLDQQDEVVNLVNAAAATVPSELELELVSGGKRVSLAQVRFEMRREEFDDAVVAAIVRLEAADTSGASVTRTYTFYDGQYYFDLDVTASGLDAGEGLACALSWNNGLPVTEPDPKADRRNFAAVSLIGEELIKDKPGDFKNGPKEHPGNVFWTGVRSKYFLAALVPMHSRGNSVRTWGDPEAATVATEVVVPMELGRDGSATASFRVYAGPIEYERLRALGVGLEKAVYQRFRFMAPLNHLVLSLVTWTYRYTPNYGVVIIIVSVLTKLVFYPLSRSSLRSMAAMKRIQPELEAIKKKYKNDPKKLNQAQMELFRKHKVNPMGGCLPILVQMPIFFALYNVLSESVQFRRAPFVSWIDDLSAPDTLFYLGGFPVHVLPIVMALTQLVQPKMTPGSDPRTQMMTYTMPIIMLVIFYGLPSGLVLYWTVNNVMTALQQYVMNRAEGAGAARAAKAETVPAGKAGTAAAGAATRKGKTK